MYTEQPRQVIRFDSSDVETFEESDGVDLALIHLNRRLTYAVHSAPIGTEVKPEDLGVAVGWGATQWGLPQDVPHKAPMQVENFGTHTFNVVSRRDTSIQKGDSGGPFLLWTWEGWALVGVASTSLPGISAQYVNLMKDGVLEWLGKAPESSQPEFPVNKHWDDQDGSRVHRVWIRGMVKPGQGENTVFNVSIIRQGQTLFSDHGLLSGQRRQ